MHNWGNFIGLNLLIFPIETIFMKLQKACIEILEQLINLVQDLTQTEYCESLIILNGNTVGKHIRHVIEFYELLMNSYHTGKLNYDQRRHNEQLAQNPAMAVARLTQLIDAVANTGLSRSLLLEASFSGDEEEIIQCPTNYYRELLYNIEHTVHHMAIIKITVREAFPHIILPEQFGVASATIRFQASNS